MGGSIVEEENESLYSQGKDTSFIFREMGMLVGRTRVEKWSVPTSSTKLPRFRVLKSGGRIAINYSPPENERLGMFWAELIPEALKIWERRTPTKETMQSALEGAGFQDVVSTPLYDDILYDPELYFEPRNFLDWDRFSRSDSTFNLVTVEEKERALAKMQQLADSGELAKWFADKERQRLAIGQTVTVYAVKP